MSDTKNLLATWAIKKFDHVNGVVTVKADFATMRLAEEYARANYEVAAYDVDPSDENCADFLTTNGDQYMIENF